MEWLLEASGDTVAEKLGRERDALCSRQGAAGLPLCTAGCCRNRWSKMAGSEASTWGVKCSTRPSPIPTSSSQTCRAFPLPPSLQWFLLLSQVTCVPGKNGKWISLLTNIPFKDLPMNVICCSAWDSGPKPNRSHSFHNNI